MKKAADSLLSVSVAGQLWLQLIQLIFQVVKKGGQNKPLCSTYHDSNVILWKISSSKSTLKWFITMLFKVCFMNQEHGRYLGACGKLRIQNPIYFHQKLYVFFIDERKRRLKTQEQSLLL